VQYLGELSDNQTGFAKGPGFHCRIEGGDCGIGGKLSRVKRQ
jgi:hypothetical protein